MPAVMEVYGDFYSDIRIVTEPPGTIEYAYYNTEPIDPDDAESYFNGMIPTLQTLSDTQLFPEMARAGVTVDPRVRYTYYNPDGSVIWSHDFDPS
jgi:hypothetical protein